MEESGSSGDLDLILDIEEKIYAIIELKYSYDEKSNVDLALAKLARNALETITTKQYGQELPGGGAWKHGY
jgi:hypothetical protein